MGRRFVESMTGMAVLACALTHAIPVAAAPAERPTGRALLFGISRYSFGPQEFGASTVAYQRSVSGNVAWRLGVTVDLWHLSEEESEESAGEVEFAGELDLTQWNHRIAVSSEWLVWRGAPVSAFFGGGPIVSYTTMQDENAYWYDFTDEPTVALSRARESSLAAGAVGVLGVQWAPSSWCGLHAEYRIRLEYFSRVRERWEARIGDGERLSHEKKDGKGFALDSEGVRAGISIYF